MSSNSGDTDIPKYIFKKEEEEVRENHHGDTSIDIKNDTINKMNTQCSAQKNNLVTPDGKKSSNGKLK